MDSWKAQIPAGHASQFYRATGPQGAKKVDITDGCEWYVFGKHKDVTENIDIVPCFFLTTGVNLAN